MMCHPTEFVLIKLTASRISTARVLFPRWSNVYNTICPLCEVQRSRPQNVTGFWVAQRIRLFYFLNLSRADFLLDNNTSFFSLSFLSFSIFILSSEDCCTVSWGVNESKETRNEPNSEDIAERSHSNVYLWLLTLRSSLATCLLRLSILPAELRPFFLYLGINFSLASGSKP